MTISSNKALIFHSTAKQVINLFIDGSVEVLLLDGDISLDLTPYLKIDDTVYNASILMTFSRVWENVFTASHDGGRLTHTEWG